eukprot:951698-Pelagomonas_calceolata.AAC.6
MSSIVIPSVQLFCLEPHGVGIAALLSPRCSFMGYAAQRSLFCWVAAPSKDLLVLYKPVASSFVFPSLALSPPVRAHVRYQGHPPLFFPSLAL